MTDKEVARFRDSVGEHSYHKVYPSRRYFFIHLVIIAVGAFLMGFSLCQILHQAGFLR